jgi:hypothetical protein
MAALCRLCHANDAVVEGRCLPCHNDRLAEAEAQRRANEKARISASRRGRSWRPEPSGHGHGTERVR